MIMLEICITTSFASYWAELIGTMIKEVNRSVVKKVIINFTLWIMRYQNKITIFDTF